MCVEHGDDEETVARTVGVIAGMGAGAVTKYADEVTGLTYANKLDIDSDFKGFNLDESSDFFKSSDDVVEGGAEIVKFNIDEIRSQLRTEPDTAFFWSGRTEGVGGAEVAADIAKGKGGVTLETTIDAKDITMPEWDFNNPSSMDAWDMASAAYAEQVSGEVRAVVGTKLRSDNTWENVELPRLMGNSNVTKITIIDPKTGIETVIFER